MATCYEASYHNNICKIVRILEERWAGETGLGVRFSIFVAIATYWIFRFFVSIMAE